MVHHAWRVAGGRHCTPAGTTCPTSPTLRPGRLLAHRPARPGGRRGDRRPVRRPGSRSAPRLARPPSIAWAVGSRTMTAGGLDGRDSSASVRCHVRVLGHGPPDLLAEAGGLGPVRLLGCSPADFLAGRASGPGDPERSRQRGCSCWRRRRPAGRGRPWRSATIFADCPGGGGDRRRAGLGDRRAGPGLEPARALAARRPTGAMARVVLRLAALARPGSSGRSALALGWDSPASRAIARSRPW